MLLLVTSISYADVGFNPTVYSVQENSGKVTVSVELTSLGNSSGGLTVDYSVTAGSATPNLDYNSIGTGTLSWTADGINTFDIIINEDQLDETDETIVLTLTNCLDLSDGWLNCDNFIGQNSATITIVNFTPPPPPSGEIKFDASNYNVTEGGQVTLTASRVNGSFGAVSVNFATSDGTAVAGSDYKASSGVLSWADGESGSKAIIINSLSDIDNEDNETFQLLLSDVTGNASIKTPSSATITIHNLATHGDVSLDENSYNITESGAVLKHMMF